MVATIRGVPGPFCFRTVRAGPSAAGVFATFCPSLTMSMLPRKTAPSSLTIWAVNNSPSKEPVLRISVLSPTLTLPCRRPRIVIEWARDIGMHVTVGAYG